MDSIVLLEPAMENCGPPTPVSSHHLISCGEFLYIPPQRPASSSKLVGTLSLLSEYTNQVFLVGASSPSFLSAVGQPPPTQSLFVCSTPQQHLGALNIDHQPAMAFLLLLCPGKIGVLSQQTL